MADLTAPLGLFTQVKLVAALRWRIARNGLRRKSNRLDLIGVIIAAALSAIFVLSAAVGFFSATRFLLASGRPSWIGLLFWGVFLVWQLFPVLAAGFAGSFEFRALLRFPLRFSSFYIIGLAYGFSDFGAIASICWILAMLVAAVPYPAAFSSLLLSSLLFILMNVTLERLLGASAERLFARRRARELFLGLFVLSMISLQFIAPVIQRHGQELRGLLPRIIAYSQPLPPSLAGDVVAAGVEGEWGHAASALAGLTIYLLIFSGLLCRRFAAQYRGEELSATVSQPRRTALTSAEAEASPQGILRLLSPQIAAILRKEYRYFFRNGFSFLTLLLPPFLVLMFSTQWTRAHPTLARHGLSPNTFFPAVMAYLILILMAPAYNSFAYEGRGIQIYFMAPLPFRNVFVGKNLTLASLLAIEVLFAIAIFAWRVGIPSLPTVLATLMAILFVVVGQFAIANWSSLSFPRKLEFGQVRNQRQSGMAVLIAFGVQIVFGAISALVLFAGRWTGNAWLPLEAFTLLAAAAAAGCRASLDSISRFAETKKESLIETLCR